MKRIIATGSVAALALVGFAGTASAEPMGKANGKAAQECFGAAYGQTGLQYGQLKKAAPHPVDGGYGLPSVLAAHGPEGAIPLCG